MNRCKNPECQKEIEENRIYCNEQCLKRFLELKKEATGKKEKKKPIELIKYTTEGINEVKEICDAFGMTNTEGNIVGQHNATILSYLRQQREGVYKTTVDKLTWLCHTSNRNIRENFLNGIEAFGIIETYTNEFGVLKWKWIGIKALRNNGSVE